MECGEIHGSGRKRFLFWLPSIWNGRSDRGSRQPGVGHSVGTPGARSSRRSVASSRRNQRDLGSDCSSSAVQQSFFDTRSKCDPRFGRGSCFAVLANAGGSPVCAPGGNMSKNCSLRSLPIEPRRMKDIWLSSILPRKGVEVHASAIISKDSDSKLVSVLENSL